MDARLHTGTGYSSVEDLFYFRDTGEGMGEGMCADGEWEILGV
jgi:hypothetical protein